MLLGLVNGHFTAINTAKPIDEEEANTSSSAKKLSTASTDNIIVTPTHCYRIIKFVKVFFALAEMLICRTCKQSISFEESGHRGLGFKIVVSCVCGRREINSGPLVNTGYEINRRIVFVMRLLGIAREDINVFCGLMDLSQGLAKSTYNKIVQHIHEASESMFKSVSDKALKEEKERNVENGRTENHLKVFGDGSWKKRGYTSMLGVTTLIANNTGKVIDLAVKSSYCEACTQQKKTLNEEEFEEWYEDHKDSCTLNHTGSSGKMEVDSVVEMFLRSIVKFGVKYLNYIGDGDSKTFTGILKMIPYGEDCPVTKNECVGHVQKRMGTRLRNKKKTEKLVGKNRLTEAIIKKLTLYYGLAIRRNVDSVEGMKKL